MADKTINQLDTIESIANDDKVPIWDNSTSSTGKISREDFLSGYQPALTFDAAPTPGSINPVTSGGIFTSNAIITASSTTITNAPVLANGSIIRIMFTSTISGSDTSTAMTLSYNGIAYSVKVGKNGSLTNFVASKINSDYYYLQAYTTLELAFDGTQFIIIGNPVVLSSSRYTIYADGGRQYHISITKAFEDYYAYIFPSDFGLSAFPDKMKIDLYSGNEWELLYFIQSVSTSRIIIRAFTVSAISSGTLTLFQSGDLTFNVTISF